MPTYITDFDYSIHTIQRVTHRLKVVSEEPEVNKKRTKVNVYIVRINSGKEADGGNEYLKLTINGDVVHDRTYGTDPVPANSTQEIFIKSFYVSHNSDGTGPINISAVYKCDYIEGWGLDIFWWTVATAEISSSLPPIDMSKPFIKNIITTANRYGTDVSVSFNASHKSYPLTSIQFTLFNLTDDQSYYRVSKITEADASKRVKNTDASYNLILEKKLNLSESNDIFFDLDDYRNGKYPLNSGSLYEYEIILTALNGTSYESKGWIKTPQKVTGLVCESEIDLLPGQTSEIVYYVIPQNAEDKTVKFHSSDHTVATIDSNGKITAVSEGMCQITVTTIDGGSIDAVAGFSTSCSVTVLDRNHFPNLETVRYLSIREMTNIIFACTFLRNKLTEKGVSVPELSEVVFKGRSHPVKEIKVLLEMINSNCLILKNFSSAAYPTESLSSNFEIIKENTESNWYIIINEWIRFLNELNSLIEKEV